MYKPVAGVEKIFGGGEGQLTPGDEFALTPFTNVGNMGATQKIVSEALARVNMAKSRAKGMKEMARAGAAATETGARYGFLSNVAENAGNLAGGFIKRPTGGGGYSDPGLDAAARRALGIG